MMMLILYYRYGCIAWQPDIEAGETEESQEEKRNEIINLIRSCGPPR